MSNTISDDVLDLLNKFRADNDYKSDSEDSYDNLYEELDTSDSESDNCGCFHKNRIEKNGNIVCTDCGNVMSSKIYDKDAFTEGGNVSRFHYRNSEDNGILKEMSKIDIPSYIKITSDLLYKKYVKNEIKRGENRQAIKFYSVYASFKLHDERKNPNTISELLGCSKKTMAKGMKLYNEICNIDIPYKKIGTVQSNTIPADIQHKILDNIIKTGCNPMTLLNLGFIENDKKPPSTKNTEETFELIRSLIKTLKDSTNIDIPEDEPMKLYTFIINNASSDDYICDRHNSRSLSAGIIYYILKKSHHITKSEYKKIVNVSEITIIKVVKEITELMDKYNITK